ncbi:hypothetical protein ACJA28_00640 [Mesomycoplasma moatsii]|uniref:hypothetical protein n=1 Tax=Mesomycoplasma moatsii TaxID=171287 RepID=UPI0003B4283A
MKKKTLVISIVSISAVSIALAAIPISFSLTYYRKTINISLDTLNLIKNTINEEINKKFLDGKKELTEKEFTEKLGVILIPYSNYFYDNKFSEKIYSLVKESIKDKKDNQIFLNTKLTYIHIDKNKYILEFELTLSKNYLYKDDEIKKEFSFLDNKIILKIDTNILYKNNSNEGTEIIDKTIIAK